MPDKYRDALLNIIRFDSVPRQVDDNLLALKGSFEEGQQDEHTADIILMILKQPIDEQCLKGIDENLVNVLNRYLEHGAYRELNELYALLKGQGAHAGHFVKFSETLASPAFTGAVVRGVNRHAKSRFPDMQTLIKNVGAPFVEPLLTALESDSNRANRLFYLKLLEQLDTSLVLEQAIGYLNDPRWYIVRNIIQVCRNSQDPQVLPHLRPLMDHPHPKIRTEATRACLHYRCEEAIARLIEMLDAKEDQTVDMAISMAMMVRDAQVAGRLIALLQSNPVLNYRLEQKKAIVKTLAETLPKGSLPVFFEILAKKNSLHPKQHRELIAEVLKVFERYDPKLLAPAIEAHAASLNAEIRQLLQRLQARMEA